MPKLQITKTVEINGTAEAAFNCINNFNEWSKWSPWLIIDPSVKNTVSDDTKYNEWEGKWSGSGNMRIIEETANKEVKIALQFIKPWKSKADIVFSVVENGNSVTVSWTMHNKLPFFMFFFKKMMETYVGMDFDRGLRMLKDLVENGAVHSKLNFIGSESFGGAKYIGIKTNCTKESMGKKMSQDIPQLVAFIEENQLEVCGEMFTQYHKWDMVRDNIVYTCGVPVKDIPANLSGNIYAGEIPTCTVNTVEHKGPYHFLGNAWSAAYLMLRNKVFKSNKKIHAFETYHNKPGDVEEKDLITRIHFPVKN